MIKGGYAGKILRVDLTKQTLTDEDLPDEATLRKYVGGVGLAAKYLYDEVPPTVKPLQPENRLIFMTGPLSGTVWPSSSRFAVMSLHPEIHTCHVSFAGGFWGAKLKMAGYDGIIVQGASSKPTYLAIHDGKPELRDASHLWGKDTHETEEAVRQEASDDQASIAAIGPAGENVHPGSAIACDRNHIASRSGTVMGSKRLKCIAISGRLGGVPVADPQALLELSIQHRKLLMSQGRIAQAAKDAGLIRLYDQSAANWRVAFKNYTDNLGQQAWGDEMVDMVKKSVLTPRPCFNCPISCAPDIVVGKGRYKGYHATTSGGLANMEGFGGMIGVMDGGAVLYLTDLCDRLGVDSTHVGQSLALLYECYERGIIGKDFTEGLELKWGNIDAAVTLMHKTVKREGLGKLIALGVKEVARAIGGDAEQYQGSFKGQGLAHDYRFSWEMILAFAVSNTGVNIEAHGVSGWFVDEEAGLVGKDFSFSKEGAPLGVWATTRFRTWENCLGVCRWSMWTAKGAFDRGLQALSLAVGWDPFTADEAYSVGLRTLSRLRLFNLRRGLTAQDDLDVGPRQTCGYEAGPLAGHPIKPYLQEMVRSYYKLMNWDPETSIPTESTLRKLGLAELIPDQKKLVRARKSI